MQSSGGVGKLNRLAGPANSTDVSAFPLHYNLSDHIEGKRHFPDFLHGRCTCMGRQLSSVDDTIPVSLFDRKA
jgi:hypothetical protein